MAQLGNAFDSGSHDDMQSGFEPIPAGEYKAIVKESDMVETKKKDGKYIQLKFEIIEGTYKGRFIWTNLNIINPSDVAVDIAQKELATLCRAVGKAVIADTQELHGIPIIMKIKIKPAKDDYPAGNSPIGYRTLGKKVTKPGSKSKPVPGEDDEKMNPLNTSEPEDETEVPWED